MRARKGTGLFRPGNTSPRRLPSSIPVLCLLAVAVSCTDKPTPAEPTSLGVQPQLSAARADEDALAIEDMLGDPLFRTAVAEVVEPAVQEPLLEAVDALEVGRVNRATRLIIQAQTEADALLDNPSADLNSHLSWSVLERYFEEAEMI